MKLQTIHAVYFTGTGTTQKVVRLLCQTLAEALGLPTEEHDFSLPAAREVSLAFCPQDLVVCGVPVYAGRVPNLLLPYLRDRLAGNGALALPVVLFGNRNCDDGLMELRELLQANGFCTVAAGAFIGEHSFSRVLAAGRPDKQDLALVRSLGEQAAAKIAALPAAPAEPVAVCGELPLRPYYTPRDRKGEPVNILKVKPKTNETCVKCGLCAQICPMGSIDPADVTHVPGVCIKCCACVKRCPVGAKYYDDPGYLYHQHELEEGYARRAEPQLFV